NFRTNNAPAGGDASRLASLRSVSPTESNGYSSHNGSHGRHHDWTEANQSSFVNGLGGRLGFVPLPFESKVDHHDRVLFYDADKHDEPDERVDAQVHLKIIKGDQCSQAGRRQTGT